MRSLPTGWFKQLPRIGILASILALALAVFLLGSPPLADDPVPAPGSCIGGVFSSDPLHCAVLEQGIAEGVITIDAIYQIGEALFIYLREPDSELGGIFDHLYRIGQEHVRASGEKLCGDVFDDSCRPGVMKRRGGFPILPLMTGYENIYLKAGGREARRSERGWAGFRQLWPPGGNTGPRSTSTAFDVSDVDLTNIPAVDCTDYTNVSTATGSSCFNWRQFPDLNIAGAHSSHGKIHVQVKPPASGEAAFVASAKAFLVEWFPLVDADHLFVYAVKYDFADLWRWTKILDRFVLSSANTVGIVRVELTTNIVDDFELDRFTFPVERIQRAPHPIDHARTRETINIVTREPAATVAALPRLLSALGIPVDAVGMVQRRSDRPWPLEYLTASQPSATGSSSDPAAAAAIDQDDLPTASNLPVLVVAAAATDSNSTASRPSATGSSSDPTAAPAIDRSDLLTANNLPVLVIAAAAVLVLLSGGIYGVFRWRRNRRVK